MALVRVDNVTKIFRTRKGSVVAVDRVSLEIEAGETVAVIGETGSGKSTLARLVLGLLRPDSGRVFFDGNDLGGLSGSEMRRLRSRIQIVFQEPRESLNPLMRIGTILREPVRLHFPELGRIERERRVLETLEMVSLGPELRDRYPRELSGGQQQRVGIARAIISHPQFIVLDEPTSSVDVSIRARLLRLLKDLQKSLGLTYLLISHDIGTVFDFSSRTCVMYSGCIVEMGPTSDVVGHAIHPYARSLTSARLDANPQVKAELYPLLESTTARPDADKSCVLVGRCPLEISACSSSGRIKLSRVRGVEQEVACIRAEEISSRPLEGSLFTESSLPRRS